MSAAAAATPFPLDTLPQRLQEFTKELLEEEETQLPWSARYDTFEAQLRSQWLEALAAATTDQTTTAALKDHWNSYVSLCISLLEHLQQQQPSKSSLEQAALRKLPFVLLEDAVDGLPLELMQDFWQECVHVSSLCSGVLWDKEGGSHVLQWIRVCNALLSKRPRMAGQILMDLAHTLPLHDRSSTKPWGSVNSSSAMEESYYQDEEDYQEECQTDEEDSPTMPSTTTLAATSASSSQQPPQQLQYSVYETFWSIQKDFGNPYAISFGTFFQNMRTILSVMESHSVGTQPASLDTTATNVPVKYLTHGRLLPLQLSDPTFRLHVLTQFLIIESFVSSQSTQLRSTLQELTTRCRALVEALPGGKRRLATLEWLLSEREVMWRDWKKNKCKPDMERYDVDDGESPSDTKKSALLDGPLKEEATATAELPEVLKAQETALTMEELAVISKNMANTVPDVFEHLEDYVDALDPEAGIEDEYHPKHDQLFRWRAMRLLSHRHLPYFSMVQKSNGDFERMVRHICKVERNMDIPGEAPEQEETRDYDVDTAAAETEPKEEKEKEEANDEEEALAAAKEDDEEEEAASTGSPEEQVESNVPAKEEGNADEVIATQTAAQEELEESVSQEEAVKSEEDAPKESSAENPPAHVASQSRKRKLQETQETKEEDAPKDSSAEDTVVPLASQNQKGQPKETQETKEEDAPKESSADNPSAPAASESRKRELKETQETKEEDAPKESSAESMTASVSQGRKRPRSPSTSDPFVEKRRRQEHPPPRGDRGDYRGGHPAFEPRRSLDQGRGRGRSRGRGERRGRGAADGRRRPPGGRGYRDGRRPYSGMGDS